MPATIARRKPRTTPVGQEADPSRQDSFPPRTRLSDRRAQPNGASRHSNDGTLSKIASQSPLMHEVFRYVRRVARVDSTVLVTGESGTGKELVAEAVHAASPRSSGPFVTINMAAVPEPLIESELFGHVKGSFTGAATNRIGRFEAANGGTLFIDEIGDLQRSSQAKLLRALENRVVTPVGGNENRNVDVRVVAATNRDLEEMIDDNGFREDLHYRLNVVRVSLPPLRDRLGDVPLLVRHFVDLFCTMYETRPLDVDQQLMAFLDSYSWPGNVRELRNCVESMVVLANSDVLTIDDVPPALRDNAVKRRTPRFEFPDDTSLAEIEQVVISETLERCDGNRTQAARKLDISVRTLQRRLASAS